MTGSSQAMTQACTGGGLARYAVAKRRTPLGQPLQSASTRAPKPEEALHGGRHVLAACPGSRYLSKIGVLSDERDHVDRETSLSGPRPTGANGVHDPLLVCRKGDDQWRMQEQTASAGWRSRSALTAPSTTASTTSGWPGRSTTLRSSSWRETSTRTWRQ